MQLEQVPTMPVDARAAALAGAFIIPESATVDAAPSAFEYTPYRS